MKLLKKNQQEIKLVMSDIDNTLLDENKKCSKDNVLAIKKIRQSGIKFGIASGRPLAALLKLIKNINLENEVDYLIGSNGGEVFDLQNNIKQYYHIMPKEDVVKIEQAVREEELVAGIYLDDILMANKYSLGFEKRCQRIGYSYQVADFAQIVTHDLPKMIFYVDPKNILEQQKKLNSLISAEYRTYLSDINLIELTKKDLSKSYGIKAISQKLGLNNKQVLCFGDAENDIEMLTDFQGVAMENATDDVKEVCEYQTLDCNHSGVAYFLNNYID